MQADIRPSRNLCLIWFSFSLTCDWPAASACKATTLWRNMYKLLLVIIIIIIIIITSNYLRTRIFRKNYTGGWKQLKVKLQLVEGDHLHCERQARQDTFAMSGHERVNSLRVLDVIIKDHISDRPRVQHTGVVHVTLCYMLCVSCAVMAFHKRRCMMFSVRPSSRSWPTAHHRGLQWCVFCYRLCEAGIVHQPMQET